MDTQNSFLNKVNLSLEEPKLKKPATRSARQAKTGNKLPSERKEAFEENYTYLRPKSMKYTQYLQKPMSKEKKRAKPFRPMSVPRESFMSREVRKTRIDFSEKTKND